MEHGAPVRTGSPLLSTSASSANVKMGPGDRISFIDHSGADVAFVISDCPTDNTVDNYAKELAKYNVKHLVRVCEPTYQTAKLTANGITVHDWAFKDGEAPPLPIVKKWIALLDECAAAGASNGQKPAIAIHCVAGLGRYVRCPTPVSYWCSGALTRQLGYALCDVFAARPCLWRSG